MPELDRLILRPTVQCDRASTRRTARENAGKDRPFVLLAPALSPM
jgi:hypothetical protein